ncbi:MAG: hypothetical protein KC583_05295 [Myxococcales bacterium]|nr:hypothetical protein [Myxococcales bacterium]
MIRRLTCLLACIAPIAFGGCIEEADDTDTDTPSIRETGYLTCSTADDACSAGQLSCYGPDGAVACVDPPPECGADGPDCACAGTTVCGTRACAERGDELVCGSGRQDAAPDLSPPADMGAPLDMSLDVPDAVIVPDVAVGDGSVVLCPEHEQAACENDPACGWRDGACVVSGEAAPFVAPTSVDFGAVPLGTTKTLDVTFEARDGFFQVSALGMSLDPAAFAVIVFDPAGGGPLGGIGEGVGELPLPLRVAEGRRLRIQLRFAPANVGQIVGDVQVGVGDFGVVTVPIAGRGE